MMKDIKGYDGYKINENGVIINKKGHVMRPALSNVGRPRVALEIHDDNGKLIRRDNKSIHRLVAEAFIPNPDNLPLVLHKDNDPLHNHVSNLRWGTASENMQQAVNDGRMPTIRLMPKNVYEVCNDDRSEVIRCKGLEGVAELLEVTKNYVRPGKVKSGKYKDFNIINTHEKVKVPISFINTDNYYK